MRRGDEEADPGRGRRAADRLARHLAPLYATQSYSYHLAPPAADPSRIGGWTLALEIGIVVFLVLAIGTVEP